MTKIQMTETVLCDIRFRDCNLVCLFLSLEHSSFEFVSDFVIRISNLNTWCHRSRQSQLTLTPPRGRGFTETNKHRRKNMNDHIMGKIDSILVQLQDIRGHL